MYDKKHNDWVFRDILIQCKILNKLIKDYEWMKDMAFSLDKAIDSLDGVSIVKVKEVQNKLLVQSNFMFTIALDMADGFGVKL